ncbi:caspase family protein [Acaryochloris sp. IP29b_bin.148]|uniref:caspase family protein n=1 Tax=Acaryochloris sp. IP29b_bin.148 TaxID=2969218 RepID=UPI00260ADDB0|nr:caspase family protein [Acaryochloris sp. IP29b_bin.148]
MKRRQFFQSGAGLLGAIGLSQLSLQYRALNYGKVLAQNTPRKLALLIGINDYPLLDQLHGPVTDVELQKQLLIHRFKFNPKDVHTLTNQQATRQGILDAYHEYLLKQAKAGDVVVFHFSGHGAQVQEFERMQEFFKNLDRDCIDDNCQNSTIVPIDYAETGSNEVQDIMGHTLLLMRSALPTDNVTFVLDCCYSGGGKRGNVVMRSRVTDIELQTNKAPNIVANEWDYQQQWLSKLGWGPQDFINRIQSDEGKGIVVTSSKQNQQSADYPFDGFYAGAFTYLLTQHLWQETAPLSVSQTIPAVARNTTQLSQHSQIPEYDPENNEQVKQKPIYHFQPSTQSAEAVILETLANNNVKLWLGGLDPHSLAAFDQGAEFSLIDDQGNAIGQVKQASPRTGLTAEGKISGSNRSAANGRFLQERVRTLPNNFKLRVGLDDTLTAEEKQTAIASLQQNRFVEVSQLHSGATVDVLLGRFTLEIQQRLERAGVPNLPEVNSIGLLTATQEPILQGSFGSPTQSVSAAIKERLKPQLKSLLIGRMLALMVNQKASKLNIELSVDHNRSRSSTTTRGSDSTAIIVPTLTKRGVETIPEGHQVTISIRNKEIQDLHIGLLVVDADADVTVLFPPTSDDLSQGILKAGKSFELGPLRARDPYGLTQLLVIASTQSLRGALKTLSRISTQQRASNREINTNTAMQDLFSSLDTRRGSSNPNATRSDLSAVDVNQTAVLSLLYEVVPAQESPVSRP